MKKVIFLMLGIVLAAILFLIFANDDMKMTVAFWIFAILGIALKYWYIVCISVMIMIIAIILLNKKRKVA